MNLQKSALIILLVIISITSYGKTGRTKRALVIGVDGFQLEQMTLCETPNLDKLNIKKAFTGGIYGSESESLTSSSPAWMTILTGVWADQHGIKENTKELLCQSPSIFKILKEADKKNYVTSVCTWAGLNLLLKQDMFKVDFATMGGNDLLSTKLMIDQINDYAPNFAFLQLDDLDHIGHVHGFGPEYTKMIEDTDNMIGNILKAVRKRELKYDEDWLVMVVTDHGRDAEGRKHGMQEINQKTVFIGMNKEGNDVYNAVDNEKPIKTLKELENTLPLTSILPTVLEHLEIPVKMEWNLDAESLLKQ